MCEDDEFSDGAECFSYSWDWRPKTSVNGVGKYLGICRGTIHLEFQSLGEIDTMIVKGLILRF